MKSNSINKLISRKATELGFDLVGFAPVSRSKTIEIYNNWLKKGYSGSMDYLKRHAKLKEDPRKLLPQTVSLVALGFNYNTIDPPTITNDPKIGKISRYAWGEDYHSLIRKKLNVLEDYVCRELKVGNISRSFVDSGPILEKEIAFRAGLGWIGKNSNLINYKKGSWFFLAEILVDFELEPDFPFDRVDCGKCTICIDACPTNAIIDDRLIDARLCISYLTIELKDSIPKKLRSKMGNHIFGCDICQNVCPWNKESAKSNEKGLYPLPENISPELAKLMNMDANDFNNRFKNSPIKRTKRRGLLRNVAVALGNWANPAAIPALSKGLHDEESLVRSHSAWAMGRILDKKAKKKLEEAKELEDNEEVLKEIVEALNYLESVLQKNVKKHIH